MPSLLAVRDSFGGQITTRTAEAFRMARPVLFAPSGGKLGFMEAAVRWRELTVSAVRV